jgi:hypothetical protein
LKIDSTTPGTFLNITSHKDVGRKSGSIITELRTLHVPLNSYLKMIGKIISSRPADAQPAETPRTRHTSCLPRLRPREMDTLRNTSRTKMSLGTLLGDPACTVPLADYITAAIQRRTDSTRTVSNHMDHSTLHDNSPQCSYFRASTNALHPPSPCQLASNEPSLRRQGA